MNGSKCTPLGRSELCFLAKRAEQGDQEAREEIIRRNTGLVMSIVNSGLTCRSSAEFDDLEQAGMLGLIKAVDRFDWRRSTAFSTYAAPWIRGEVIRAMNEHRKTVSMPDERLSLGQRIAEFAEAFEESVGHQPSIAQIASNLGEPVDVVLGVVGASRSVSLDHPEARITLIDTGASYDAYARVELRLLLIAAEGELTPHEHEVIRRRYIHEQSIKEIAAATSLSPRSVYVTRDAGLEKLRQMADAEAEAIAA